MRTLIVVIAFLGLAVSGCAESQPAYVPAVVPVIVTPAVVMSFGMSLASVAWAPMPTP